jgi:hypothetical protein
MQAQVIEPGQEFFDEQDISEIQYLTEGLERSMSLIPEFDLDKNNPKSSFMQLEESRQE